MDKLHKELRRLTNRELERVDTVLAQIEKGDIDTLQVKQMQGYKRMYRVRVGRLRVIYEVLGVGVIKLIAVRRRDDNTYSDF